ncbi:prepilin-type N-terminal cleavage/methylation domain-containing protein [Candidatus Saccharibacteria bacterium]|nr:prepilin-type N-terminal cleavage/methylation domain-containing protein [Candidatus Saccharibacteria bacterium]
MSDNKKYQVISKGFTVVELLVVVTVTSILALAFLDAITNFYSLITRNNAANDLTTSSQNLLRSTVEALRVGDGVRQTGLISDANAPAGGWSTSNSAFVIVIASPALDTSRNYVIDSDTGSPYMNELVYFKSGTSLMQRALANPNAAGNSLKTSCPAELATSNCPADKKLAEYVKNMIFTLYDQDNSQTNDPLAARSIKIDLAMEQDISGAPLTLNNSIRVTLRNRF